MKGFLHAEQGRGCDDAHGWSVGETTTVLVVADGAGSRPGTSAIGAHVAVAAVLAASADPAFIGAYSKDATAATGALLEQAIVALRAEARMLALELRALATTLCIAVIADERATIAQIGDGVAVVERASGKLETVAIAERFEYANEVVFATADDAVSHLKVFTATEDPVRSIALTTDGLRYKILDDIQESRPFEAFFRDSWTYARSTEAASAGIEGFLGEVDDQTGDDKTLILAVRDFEGDPGEPSRLTARPPLRAGSALRDATT